MILKFSSLWSVCRNVYINMFFFLTEIEAKEACDWLKAAGFPQYAQLYEGNTHTHACQFYCNKLPCYSNFCSRLTPYLIFSIMPVFLFFHYASIFISPFSGPLRSISRLQFLSREMGHGKGLVITAGICTAFFSLHPSTFILLPCPQLAHWFSYSLPIVSEWGITLVAKYVCAYKEFL